MKQAVWNPTNWQILNRIDPTSATGLRRGTIGALSSVPNGEFPASKSSLVRVRPSKVRGSRHPIALRVVLSNSERPLARPAKVDRRPKIVRELLVQYKSVNRVKSGQSAVKVRFIGRWDLPF